MTVRTQPEYTRVFDETNQHWSNDYANNKMFIKAQMNWFQDRLNALGYLFLNEVYSGLGIPVSGSGQLVGWHKEVGDGVFRFKVIEHEEENKFILEFDVDGIIYSQLPG